jgi:hypothetical protein
MGSMLWTFAMSRAIEARLERAMHRAVEGTPASMAVASVAAA